MKKGKIIYISGQITGIEKQAFDLFMVAENKLSLHGYTVINPMTLGHQHDKSWANYMKEDIRALLQCDCIYMLDNWKKSKGAKLEHEIAQKLGLEIIYEDKRGIELQRTMLVAFLIIFFFSACGFYPFISEMFMFWTAIIATLVMSFMMGISAAVIVVINFVSKQKINLK